MHTTLFCHKRTQKVLALHSISADRVHSYCPCYHTCLRPTAAQYFMLETKRPISGPVCHQTWVEAVMA